MADGNFHSGPVLLLRVSGSGSSPPPPCAQLRHAATVVVAGRSSGSEQWVGMLLVSSTPVRSVPLRLVSLPVGSCCPAVQAPPSLLQPVMVTLPGRVVNAAAPHGPLQLGRAGPGRVNPLTQEQGDLLMAAAS
ncbi:hypothetical protein D4764_22G0000720 [Takifugu flavidus]|uniref:Uncharacterized protein n=1 Tax=Takifugu flavidus TaxID=433684 RepID=A0A5C6NBC9_9TELE|nr:hypothetical protein D4764_22G0000720 [Takifugu flavidus]